MVGRGRLPSTRREGGGGRLWVADERCSPLHFIVCAPLAVKKQLLLVAKIVCSALAVRVAVGICGWRTSDARPYKVRANARDNERPPPPSRRVEDERFSTPPSAQTSKSGTVGFADGVKAVGR